MLPNEGGRRSAKKQEPADKPVSVSRGAVLMHETFFWLVVKLDQTSAETARLEMLVGKLFFFVYSLFRLNLSGKR